MTELENELAAAVEATLPKTSALHVVNKGEPTAVEYLATIERAQIQLRTKLQRERLAIIENHDRLWAEIDADTKRKLLDVTSRIEREHAEARRALESETTARLRENDDLAKRMGA
jgi:hypothetical protein